MKILYIAPASNPHSIRWLQNFIASSENPLYEITWVTFEQPPATTNFYAPKVLINYLFLPCYLYSYLRLDKSSFDFCHVHSLAKYLTPLFFLDLNLFPVILTAWGSDIYISRKNLFIRLLQSYFLRYASFLTADSREMCDSLITISRKKPVYRINFGTDCSSFVSSASLPGSIRHILEPGKYILSTRNFYKIYDIQTVCIAYSLLPNNIKNTYMLVLVGKGPELTEIENLCKDLGIIQNVFMPGYLPMPDLPGLYANAALYISSSLSDAGLAASTAEAMACKTIPIVTDVKENSAWVSEQLGTGFLFQCQDYTELSKQITRALLLSPDELDYFRTCARSIILRLSNSELEFKRFSNILSTYLK